MADISSVSGKLPVLYGARPLRPTDEPPRPDEIAPGRGDVGAPGRLAETPGRVGVPAEIDGRHGVAEPEGDRFGSGRTGDDPSAGSRSVGGESDDHRRRRGEATGRALVPLARFDPGAFAAAGADDPSGAAVDGATTVGADLLRRRTGIAAYENANRGPAAGPLLTDVKI